MTQSNGFARATALLFFSLQFFASGCVATQDWVKTYVPEQLFPVNKRVSDTETNVTQLGGKVSTVEGQVQTMSKQIADIDSRLNQTTAKADQALDNLQRLKLDRKLVLDLKQGTTFASNSTVLTDQSKKDIDSFLSDLSGDAGGTSGADLGGHDLRIEVFPVFAFGRVGQVSIGHWRTDLTHPREYMDVPGLAESPPGLR